MNSEFEGIPADSLTIKIELRTTPYVLGVSRLLSPPNNSPVWERTDDSVGLVAEANKHTTIPTTFTPARDDFAMSVHGGTLPFYKDIDIVNMRVSDGAIVAKLSDPNSNFTWGNDIGKGAGNNSSGEAVDVMTYYPGHYIKRYQDATHEYIQLSMWNFEGAMYVEPYYRGTFEAIDGSGNTLRSYAGGTVSTEKSILTFRTRAGNNENNKMSIGDWRDFDFLCLYLIKYADYNSQGMVGNGVVSGSKVATDNNNARNTLKGRDGYIGTNGSTSVWCLGLCNFWGNVYEFIDGITINNWTACIATNPIYYSEEATSNTTGYMNMEYQNCQTNGYPIKTGYDSRNQFQLIAFPIAVGTDSTAGFCDYYHQANDFRVVVRGGSISYTTNAGAFCFNLYNIPFSDRTSPYVGCRLLKEIK